MSDEGEKPSNASFGAQLLVVGLGSTAMFLTLIWAHSVIFEDPEKICEDPVQSGFLVPWILTRTLPALFLVCVTTAVATFAARLVLPKEHMKSGHWVPLVVVCGGAIAWLVLAYGLAFGRPTDSEARLPGRNLTVILDAPARVRLADGEVCELRATGQTTCTFVMPPTRGVLNVAVDPDPPGEQLVYRRDGRLVECSGPRCVFLLPTSTSVFQVSGD